MATTTASTPASLSRVFFKPLSSLATAGILGVIALAITVQFPSATLLATAVVTGALAVVTWMLLSERYEWTLAVLMLYIGLADGYLKFRTGSNNATLLRDVLLYAIVAGALIRTAVRRSSFEWPPLTTWVVAWIAVIGVQLANPANGSLFHALASLRPHLEWVPLFFLGYFVMRSRARLRRFLFLLVVIATINGIVGFIQLNLTPEQLSGWGPGYERAINGEETQGGISGRVYYTNSGEKRTRPFGLGGDFGFGGKVGLIALPAALALLALVKRQRSRVLLGLLAFGTGIAVLTSEARVAVVGAVVSGFAYAGFAVTTRARMRAVFALAAVVVVGYGAIGVISSNSHKGVFDHYETIASPGAALSTTYDYRRATFAKIPVYAAEIPFGGGFGSAGPAAGVEGGTSAHRDAESEPTYLLIEAGIPGLLVMLGFFGVLLYLSVMRIRRIADREMRLLLTGIAAPIFGIFISGIVGINTASTPASPYLWFAAGILSFWLVEGRVEHAAASGHEGASRRPAVASTQWSTV